MDGLQPDSSPTETWLSSMSDSKRSGTPATFPVQSISRSRSFPVNLIGCQPARQSSRSAEAATAAPLPPERSPAPATLPSAFEAEKTPGHERDFRSRNVNNVAEGQQLFVCGEASLR